ncbi:MAG TPA: DUF167 domain-containing protein [Pirellulaceae bacterium]|nr:DUF167 domain-containing protein [Pirellulaceae bacterium]
MIALEPHPRGVLLPVRAQPGSRKNELKGEQNGALKVAVTQVAEKGKANKAIIDLLCDELHLRKSQVELIAGETAGQKKFLIHDLNVEELQARLATLIRPS